MKLFGKSRASVLELICLATFVFLCTDFRREAQSLPPDVGLVTQLSGEATYWNEDYQKKPEKVQAFMKIRQGDYFKAGSGVIVQLVYFQNGRQETWRGPAAFRVGDVESRVEGEKGRQVQPEVVILPTAASQEMRRIPILLRRARLSRSGAMQVRGTGESLQKAITPTKQEQAEIERAKEIYQGMRKQNRADDIMPELNLLGILADYEQYEEMEKVIKEALKMEPGNEILKDLGDWVKAQRSKPTPKK